ncbi:hypothetical protein LEP1GSC163_3032 [Leptospira santarosai str. CBC379]|nr:hypothetical protein LEP1GSC163_3032 [Leptospira santarosai str. CBC379]
MVSIKSKDRDLTTRTYKNNTMNLFQKLERVTSLPKKP